ncbi:Tm-1-like ATP-binding domain-containing protein [Georgenia alba]|uniref:Tm-1-like ATP-binding domain-containing protein n=1 Tax=Georgenia alba TaxID=2233858 RepID=A0ABW2QDY5_9MICO
MSADGPVIAVLATVDTKAAEAHYLADQVAVAGGTARVVDVGLGTGHGAPVDVAAEALAARTGRDLADLRAGPRGEAMATMGEAAGAQLTEWHAAGELHGAVAVGGNQGSAVAAIAMRQLPIGPPKLIVSTVASGNVRDYVRDSDITMQFSVGDLLGGPNRVTGMILRRAAAGVVAMARAVLDGPAGDEPGRPTVGVTAFGNTEPAVVAAIEHLDRAGVASVPFHASGACGSAMERLVDDGILTGVLDLTTHEVLGELEPADIYAPVRPGRLTAAGRRGVPQVVAPGGLEYFCFGALESIPERYRDRPVHVHNPYNTNVRTSAEELRDVGRLVAERLNAARGPAAVLIPLKGWSGVGSPGGVLHDPDTNRAFVEVLESDLDPRVRLELHDVTINDPAFAAAAASTLLELMPAAR